MQLKKKVLQALMVASVLSVSFAQAQSFGHVDPCSNQVSVSASGINYAFLADATFNKLEALAKRDPSFVPAYTGFVVDDITQKVTVFDRRFAPNGDNSFTFGLSRAVFGRFECGFASKFDNGQTFASRFELGQQLTSITWQQVKGIPLDQVMGPVGFNARYVTIVGLSRVPFQTGTTFASEEEFALWFGFAGAAHAIPPNANLVKLFAEGLQGSLPPLVQVYLLQKDLNTGHITIVASAV